MNEVYRQATLDDAEQVLGVVRRAYRSIGEFEIEFAAVHADLEMVRTNIAEHASYVLEIGGMIVATISLRSLPEVTDLPFLYNFAVDPAYANRGVGSKLLAYAEEAVVRDILLSPAVVLATSAKHPWLLPMYERKGYVRFYERELGRDDKLVFLRKNLLPEVRATTG